MTRRLPRAIVTIGTVGLVMGPLACATAPRDMPGGAAPPPFRAEIAPVLGREEAAWPSHPTLPEVQARIFEHANLHLAAEAVRIDEAHGREEEAALSPNPYLLLRERRVDDFDPLDTGMFEIEVGQTFELGGKRAARRELARAEAAEATQEVRALAARTLFDAEVAFYHLLRLQEELDAAEEEVAATAALAHLARSRFSSGRADRASALRFEVARDEARIAALALERRRAQACLDLDELVGVPVGSTQGVTGGFASAQLSGLDRKAAHRLLATHPRLRAREMEAEAALRAIDAARADAWPDLTVGIAYEHENESGEDLGGLLVRLPLPLWNRAQGRRAETEAALRRARLGVQAEELSLAVELDRALLAYGEAWSSAIAYAVEVIPRLDEARGLAQSAFDAGRLSSVEVLDATLAGIRARRTRLDYLEEQGRAAAAIRYLIGAEER